ncbi:MAG: hypothetical protein OWT27_09000 [Firmicutes bacterium]|nr:hypothetical protein [Bacillota bacterium]
MSNLIQFDPSVLARYGLTEDAARELIESGITLDEYAEMMGAAVADDVADARVILPRYKINKKHWENLSGDLFPEITGIVLHSNTNRALFDRADEDNPKLLCRSADGKTGTYVEEGEDGARVTRERTCATCPFNQFTTDENGKSHRDCKETRRVLFLESGSKIPAAIYLPYTSQKVWDTFVSAVLSQGAPLCTREIRLTLDQRSEGSRTWGVLKSPEVLRTFTGLEAIRAIKQAKEMVESLDQKYKPDMDLEAVVAETASA